MCLDAINKMRSIGFFMVVTSKRPFCVPCSTFHFYFWRWLSSQFSIKLNFHISLLFLHQYFLGSLPSLRIVLQHFFVKMLLLLSTFVILRTTNTFSSIFCDPSVSASSQFPQPLTYFSNRFFSVSLLVCHYPSFRRLSSWFLLCSSHTIPFTNFHSSSPISVFHVHLPTIFTFAPCAPYAPWELYK